MRADVVPDDVRVFGLVGGQEPEPLAGLCLASGDQGEQVVQHIQSDDQSIQIANWSRFLPVHRRKGL